MFFLRHKRQRRDQGAGLVFRWRGARRHRIGQVMALVVTGSFFAFFVKFLPDEIGKKGSYDISSAY